MRLRTTLAAAVLTTAIAVPMSLLDAAAVQANNTGTIVPGSICHTVDVHNGTITALNTCTSGPRVLAKPTHKATPPEGYGFMQHAS